MLRPANILPWRSREQMAVAERIGSLSHIRRADVAPAPRSLQDAARIFVPDGQETPRALQARLPFELPPAA